MNEQRIAMLKQFMEDDPTDPFNIYALAVEYYEEKTTSSLQLFEQLLTKHRNYLPTYYKAAHLYWETEQWNKAEEVFKKGIALAEAQNEQKALQELKSAYSNFQFDQM